MIGRSLGKYQIIEKLGEGGMATVYKAYDPSLERYVAIKVIRAMNQIDSDFLIRFQREARALAKLDHPYILKVLDYGEEGGIPYLVMPFVAHGTLKQYINKRIGFKKAIEIIIPIAEALSYAHKRKIIHRDIKPANILFGESGEPILSDFGIAKMLDAGDQTQLTGTGLGIGTPAYMAPEQWNGVVDERTDIYALGIVLYELITGRCPFQADTPAAILIKQVQDPLPRPKNFIPDLPENVETLLFKALAKDSKFRFQNMQDFVEAMNTVLLGRPVDYALPTQLHIPVAEKQISSYKPSDNRLTNQKAGKNDNRKKWLPVVIGGGVLLVVSCVVLILIFSLSNLDFFKGKEPTLIAEIENTPVPTITGEGGNQQITEPSTQLTLTLQATPTEMIVATKTVASVETIENLPDDIPVFTPNNGDVTITTVEGSLMFSYSTNENRETVLTFMEDEMTKSNWELVSTSEMAAQGASMKAFMKGDRTTVITVSSYQETQTYIQLIIADES